MVKHRQLRNKTGILAVILSALLFLSLPAAAKVFNAQTFTLENGLQVIVVPNHRAPVVTHMVWYKVGAADEPQNMSGMAHYFEHLMFKGTNTLAPGEFSKTVKKLGGNDNAFTGQDYTAYYESIAVQHLEKMMEMEADRMVNLDVPEAHFKSEKSVVLEERRQRTENSPKTRFGEQVRSALFVNHPYGTPTIGWMSEIKAYEWEDVKKFYDLYYAPNNAIVIISGDVTAKEVRPMTERTYGKLKPKDIPPRKRPQVAPANGDTLMTLQHKSINQRSFSNLRLAPSFNGNYDDALALEVLQEIMSGGPTTRLYKHLVVDRKRAIAVGLSYDGSALDDATIIYYGTPSDDVSLEELAADVKNEIRDVIENGVSKTEVNEAIQRLQDSADYARDSLSGPAMMIGYALTTGSTLDEVENWPEAIAKITAADIQRVAKTYLDDDQPWHRPAIQSHYLPVEESSSQIEDESNKEAAE